MEFEITTKRARKKPKRYGDSEDEDPAPPSPEIPTPTSRRQSSAPTDDTMEEPAEDMDDFEQAAFEQFPRAAKSKGKRKMADDEPAPKKRAKRIWDSEEEEEEYMQEHADQAPTVEDEDEDDFVPTPKPSKNAKKSQPARTTKRKVKSEQQDEPPSRKRPKALKVDDIHIDVVGDSQEADSHPTSAHPTTPQAVQHDSPAPQPPKKLKLPTIKKNKLAGSGVSTPTSAGLGPKKSLIDIPAATNKPAQKNLSGATDVDLSNKSIYEEIFKGTLGDGGSSRTGLNRRTKEEERRKELNRMRDEYTAKRADEMATSFDLQSQSDRISRFEEELERRKSSALYPNFLAAKWRENWERERSAQKRPKESPTKQNGFTTNGVEEGEVY